MSAHGSKKEQAVTAISVRMPDQQRSRGVGLAMRTSLKKPSG